MLLLQSFYSKLETLSGFVSLFIFEAEKWHKSHWLLCSRAALLAKIQKGFSEKYPITGTVLTQAKT